MSGEEETIPNVGEGPAEGWGLEGKGKMPSMEEILSFIDQASGLTDEERQQIKEDVIKSRTESMEGLDFQQKIATAATAGGIFTPSTILFVSLVLLIALVLGIFVYKIIKNEKEKEKAKELKRKARLERRSKTKRS